MLKKTIWGFWKFGDLGTCWKILSWIGLKILHKSREGTGFVCVHPVTWRWKWIGDVEASCPMFMRNMPVRFWYDGLIPKVIITRQVEDLFKAGSKGKQSRQGSQGSLQIDLNSEDIPGQWLDIFMNHPVNSQVDGRKRLKSHLGFLTSSSSKKFRASLRSPSSRTSWQHNQMPGAPRKHSWLPHGRFSAERHVSTSELTKNPDRMWV